MPQQYDDTWHQLEAADERAWLDAWARARAADEQPIEGQSSKPGFEARLAQPAFAA